MSYQEKMLKHLRNAEEADALVNQIKAEAEKRIRRKHPTADARRMTYYLKTELSGNSLYTVKGSSRNYNVSMATMYGIAAFLERMPDSKASE